MTRLEAKGQSLASFIDLAGSRNGQDKHRERIMTIDKRTSLP